MLRIIIAIITWITVDLLLGRYLKRRQIPPYAPQEASHGDAVFFMDGNELFTHMLNRVANAKRSIHMHFYIFRDDQIGNQMMKALIDRVDDGVDVRLMVDWGGYAISRKGVKALQKGGVKVAKVNKPRLPLLFSSINHRNHRKVTVIDDTHGYVGGFNIGDEYLGRDTEVGNWRDYHLYVTGGIVEPLQQQFARDWLGAANEQLEVTATRTDEGSLPIMLHSTDGAHVTEHISFLLRAARKRVFIGTPYFIPGSEMFEELRRLLKRGVKLEILIPKYPDHPLVKDAAFRYLPTLIDEGAEVKQFTNGFYHSKALIVDDTYIDIGTSNFDQRSFYLNNELNCTITDKEFIDDATIRIRDDFDNHAEPINKEYLANRSLLDRSKQKIATSVESFL
ncbi:cardiolipin synthase [Paenalkalicoccus suaedae]|uniref:Cardiolipin synthase n=1 Tax=Paenalkalicoccus suaedae TaxID=2592382 RepID=A0A859FIA0_9BACI|nr:cardiolipin synthase [Paenalkalicoccus suaedae]QKS72799.1 cardiolipin synthase [Paenalkalicoccus suaedae]